MNRSAAAGLLLILAIDVLMGFRDLRGLGSISSAGVAWATWRYEYAAVGRSVAAAVVLLAVWFESEYRNIALFLYATLKVLLSIVLLLLAFTPAAGSGGFAKTISSNWNWWHPVSALLFAALAVMVAAPYHSKPES